MGAALPLPPDRLDWLDPDNEEALMLSRKDPVHIDAEVGLNRRLLLRIQADG